MRDATNADDSVRAIALLEEPTRRRVFDYVIGSREPVGRDETAAEVGISRELAAFHLDRLADGGMLDIGFRRRTGRTGPGAGRPAKLYRRTSRDVTVSFPPRHYEVAADAFAAGIERLGDPAVVEAVAHVARERGAALGAQARRAAGPRPSRRRLVSALQDLLRGLGYEPYVDGPDGELRLRNCPFATISASHRDLTCGMNLAWAEGVTESMGVRLQPRLAPEAGQCCVVFGRPAREERSAPPR